MEKLYTIAEAAERLGGISVWTVQSWLSKGTLARTKVGARTMISERDVIAFLARCNSGRADLKPLESSE